MKKIFSKKRNIIALLTFILFIFLVVMQIFFKDGLKLFDDFIYNIVKSMISPTTTSIFKIITFMASSLFLLILCLIFLILKKRKLSINSFIVLLGSTFLNQILKLLFSRTRPEGLMLIEEKGYSFPSGHASAAMTFYGFLIYLLTISNIKTSKKYIFISFFVFLIFLIGLSRIYLGVHYASDVLAGYLVSYVYLCIVINIYEINKK